MNYMTAGRGLLVGVFVVAIAALSRAADLPGEGPRLGGVSITHDQIAGGEVSLLEIRKAGRRIFATPFNKRDGYGDGPMNISDPTSPGGRPTLQGNGTFLRVNGLDGQSCLECHSFLSTAKIPATFAVGGAGGSVTNAMFLPTAMDVADTLGQGFASFDGRFINPPFLFGAGGIELVAKEMTVDLQRLKEQALANPGTDVRLLTKGVDFGVIRFAAGVFDLSRVEGIDADLVVRPFGRKGEFATTRAFDQAALQFHFGMQPVEIVGVDVDADGDGVVNEILVGELSALAMFTTTIERPRQVRPKSAGRANNTGREGAALFRSIGCADCHIPELATESSTLTYSFPAVETDPAANVFYEVDLSQPPMSFRKVPRGGIVVSMFADLKRHDMGPALAEDFGSSLDSQFTTARLWGVADSAPYMHDGRALTIGDAILMHGGEGATARDAYAQQSDADKASLLIFLHSLRTPKTVGADLGD